MGVLVPETAGVVDPRSGEEHRTANPALVGVALPPPERRVPRERPAPRVVTARVEAPEVVETGDAVRDVVSGVGDVVTELVHRTVGSAFGRSPVVGDRHHDGVLQLTGRREVIEQSSEVVVGVRDERGADLHHPGVEPAPVRLDLRPRFDPHRPLRQHRPGRDDAECLLAIERRRPPRIPPVVEATAEPIDPLPRGLVRRVRRARCVPQEERPLGMRAAQLPHVRDRMVREIGVEVVALGRRPGWLDVVRVVHQVGRPLVRLTVEEPVVPIEAQARGPHVVGAGHTLIPRDEMPLPHAERRVAGAPEDLGERPRGPREHPRVAREVHREVRQHPHPDAVVVAPGQQARARR